MRREINGAVGWAKRSVPTAFVMEARWWARRKRAFAHPTAPRHFPRNQNGSATLVLISFSTTLLRT
ncbi:hypothetical protein ABIF86_006861 [Bradyrhizobium japonicum]